jgi:outer membrane protein insertion porin family
LSTASSYNNPAWLSLNERGQPFGGNMQLYYNLEVEFPIIEVVGIKGVVFQDGGNAWTLEDTLCGPDPISGDPATKPCEVDISRLRTSWGFGIRWFSPLGPLRFEWGFPFHTRPYEDDVEFQFTVGNAF